MPDNMRMKMDMDGGSNSESAQAKAAKKSTPKHGIEGQAVNNRYSGGGKISTAKGGKNKTSSY